MFGKKSCLLWIFAVLVSSVYLLLFYIIEHVPVPAPVHANLLSLKISSNASFKQETLRMCMTEIGKINQTTNDTHPRVVLIYTPFMGNYPWKGLEDTQNFTQFKGKHCQVQTVS